MVEPADADDVAAIARLEELALGADAWSEALVREGVCGTLPSVRYLVARRQDRVVGHAVVSVVAEIAELQRIAVDPGHRRSGIASDLLAAVVGIARAAGADRLLLEVREDNQAARGFYAAAGFARLHRRPRYYRDGAAALVLALPLTGPDVKVCTTS